MTGYGNFSMGDPFGGDPHGPPPGPPPAGPPRPGETNTLATLSVIFAFVFAPAGAVLGHLGLGQIARTGERGRDRALVGVALSYAVIVVAVVALVVHATLQAEPSAPTAATPTTTVTTTGPVAGDTPRRSEPAPSTPTVAPKVDAAALPAVLVPLEELRTLLGDPGLTALGTSEAPEMPEGAVFDDVSCIASFVSGTPIAYDQSEQRQFLGADAVNTTNGNQVDQVAVRFDDDATARRALDRYAGLWRDCAGKSAKWTYTSGRVVTITYGAPVDVGGGIFELTNTVAESPVLQLRRVIAVKANVLVDNGITSVHIGDRAVDVTRAMLDRVPN